jgi:serine/threonine protein kinase
MYIIFILGHMLRQRSSLHPAAAVERGYSHHNFTEHAALATWQHPNIVPVKGLSLWHKPGCSDPQPAIVTPWASKGTAHDFFNKPAPVKVALATFVRLAVGVGSAISFLHNKGVLHLDIKPANILIHRDQSGECSLLASECVTCLPL